MSHNKMYRQIEGYEEALNNVCDVVDLCDDAKELIRYGKDKEEILKILDNAENIIKETKSLL